MSDCAKCKHTRSDGLVGCEGPCNKWFHHSCINLNKNDFDVLHKNKNLFYLCDSCIRNSDITEKITLSNYNSNLNKINEKMSQIGDVIESKLQLKLSEFDTIIDSLRSSMSALIKSEMANALKNILDETIVPKIDELKPKLDQLTTTSVPAKPTFRDAVVNSSVLLLPKNKEQRNSATKSDLFHNINPLHENIKVSKVKNISNGGLSISCPSEDDLMKFKTLATDKLADKYDVKEAGKLHPRIKVVGITEKHEEATLVQLILSQNTQIFNKCKPPRVINVKPLKKSANVFQAVFEVDAISYHAAMNVGKLALGYDYCTVYDALEVRRCFRCCGFNHKSINCKKNLACPKCSEEHELKNCANSTVKCINCITLNKIKPGVNVDHSAWDNNCPILKEKINKMKCDLFGNI